MGRQYFEQYKALMHVANETKEELAKTVDLKKASLRYQEVHACRKSSVVISRFGFALSPRTRVESKPVEAKIKRPPIHKIAGLSE